MNKKQYTQPTIDIICCEPEAVIATSTRTTGIDPSQSETPANADAPARRGSDWDEYDAW